ncbi:MAG TPA: aldehyde dehydrogenase family protein [Bacteroidales bacterium]|nr:aldehyde dehydrogenase family protein [Bacteroidales bacterium]
MDSPENVHELRARQLAFFMSGETRSIAFRKAALCRLRNTVRKYEKEIAGALNRDLNKNSFEAYATETGIVLHEISTMIRNMRRWAAGKIVTTPLFAFPSLSRVVPEPFGRVLIISPWNYPFQLPMVPLIGAIAAGNVAVIRQSTSSPAINVLIKRIIGECFPEEHAAVIDCSRECAEEVVKMKWDMIFFTGSTETGRKIYMSAASNLTPVILELGGKSPVIVEKDAYLPTAARRIVWGKTLNAGQTCISPDYLFVQREVKDRLLELMKQEIRKMFGDEPLANREMTRLISKKAFERLSSYISKDKILAGGLSDISKLMIEPTILESSLSDKCMQQEIFGPVLPMISYENIDEAISYINSGEKPLALYLFTRSRKTRRRVIKYTSSGACLVNDVILHIANKHLPFGGVGASGLGRYHGKESFRAFSNLKAIMHTTARVDIPVKYPPYGSKEKIMKIFLR